MKKDKFVEKALKDLNNIQFERIKKDPVTGVFLFSDEQFEDIMSRAKRGETLTYISRRYGCSRNVISKVVREGRAGEKLPETITRKG